MKLGVLARWGEGQHRLHLPWHLEAFQTVDPFFLLKAFRFYCLLCDIISLEVFLQLSWLLFTFLLAPSLVLSFQMAACPSTWTCPPGLCLLFSLGDVSSPSTSQVCISKFAHPPAPLTFLLTCLMARSSSKDWNRTVDFYPKPASPQDFLFSINGTTMDRYNCSNKNLGMMHGWILSFLPLDTSHPFINKSCQPWLLKCTQDMFLPLWSDASS